MSILLLYFPLMSAILNGFFGSRVGSSGSTILAPTLLGLTFLTAFFISCNVLKVLPESLCSFKLAFSMPYLVSKNFISGFLLKDAFAGMGSDFLKESVALSVSAISVFIESEFVPLYIKVLPLIGGESQVKHCNFFIVLFVTNSQTDLVSILKRFFDGILLLYDGICMALISAFEGSVYAEYFVVFLQICLFLFLVYGFVVGFTKKSRFFKAIKNGWTGLYSDFCQYHYRASFFGPLMVTDRLVNLALSITALKKNLSTFSDLCGWLAIMQLKVANGRYDSSVRRRLKLLVEMVEGEAKPIAQKIELILVNPDLKSNPVLLDSTQDFSIYFKRTVPSLRSRMLELSYEIFGAAFDNHCDYYTCVLRDYYHKLSFKYPSAQAELDDLLNKLYSNPTGVKDIVNDSQLLALNLTDGFSYTIHFQHLLEVNTLASSLLKLEFDSQKKPT